MQSFHNYNYQDYEVLKKKQEEDLKKFLSERKEQAKTSTPSTQDSSQQGGVFKTINQKLTINQKVLNGKNKHDGKNPE